VMGNRFKRGNQARSYATLAPLCWQPAVDPYCAAFFPKSLRRLTLRVSRLHQRRLPKDGPAGSMEFASEMIIEASRFGLRIAEVPTTQSTAGRTGPSHLLTWWDGWRHLRLLLLYCPRWLFPYPGGLLMLLGLATGIWLMPHSRNIGSLTFDVHTLLYAATAMLRGCNTTGWTNC
jgi:hypothetical protein